MAQNIEINIGVDTILDFGLSTFNFDGIEKVIFTIKNVLTVDAEPVLEREFFDAKDEEVTITAEESLKLIAGAHYDFNAVLNDGRRIALGDVGEIILVHGVGDKFD